MHITPHDIVTASHRRNTVPDCVFLKESTPQIRPNLYSFGIASRYLGAVQHRLWDVGRLTNFDHTTPIWWKDGRLVPEPVRSSGPSAPACHQGSSVVAERGVTISCDLIW